MKPTQINIRIGDNLRGRVHASQIYDSFETIYDKKNPLSQFKSGQEIFGRVIGFHCAKTHNYLPFSHAENPANQVVDLTIRPFQMDKSKPIDTGNQLNTLADLQLGQETFGFIQKIEEEALWVQIGSFILGRSASIFEVSDDPIILSDLFSAFKEGQAVKCNIIAINPEKHIVDISLIDKKEKDTFENLQTGKVMVGKIERFDNVYGATVKFSATLHGRVHLCDINDKLEPNFAQTINTGKFVKVVVVDVDLERRKIFLSMKESDIKGVSSGDLSCPSLGDMKSGFIKSISEKGCFVDFSRTQYARVKIAELSDDFIQDWKSMFKPGTLVTGKIISADAENNRYEMSLKKSKCNPEFKKLSYTDLEPGMRVSGTVKNIQKFGIFINIDSSDISGLCHISEASDNPVSNLERLYSVGDPVQALILKIDAEKDRVSLSLKASNFNDVESVSSDDTKMSDKSAEIVCQSSVIENNLKESEIESCEESDAEDKSMDIDSNPESLAKRNLYTALNSAPLDVDFSWDASTNLDANIIETDDSSDEESEARKNQNNKREKRKKKEIEEERVNKLEEAQNQDKEPETGEEFEKKILETPNNSYIWIKYMAFEAGLTEIEKSREIAERALSVISFREQQEKLNVWVAYLNLENTFGTQESLNEIFERACQYNESKKVHMHLAQIYERSNKPQLAESLHKKMCKKFNQSSKVHKV